MSVALDIHEKNNINTINTINTVERNYVAISPDGSIIAEFNPDYNDNNDNDNSYHHLLVKNVDTDDKKISIKIGKINGTALEWSLAVSDINENICFVAISYTNDKAKSQPENVESSKLYTYYNKTYDFLGPSIFIFLIIILIIPFICILPFILYSHFHERLFPSYNERIFNNEVFEQFQLLSVKSEDKGKIMVFKINVTDLNSEGSDLKSPPFSTSYSYHGVVGFLPSKNKTILVCMNYIKIQMFHIKNNNDKFDLVEKDCFLLPENLFKELENSKDEKRNWKYLLKSRYQEFLMTDRNYNKQLQHIEIYNLNTSQLVNVFCKKRGKKNKKNNEPGIFAVSTDSDLFAYSYGDNTITIYLMESGLEVVSKTFNCVSKIKFLEFIDKNNKLFFIADDENGKMEFHFWVLSGCLNDHFTIGHKTSILSNYVYSLAKANGMVIFLDDKKNIKILHDLINENTMKSKKPGSENFSGENFKEFKDLYNKIKDDNKPELDDDMTITMKIACGLLVHLYNNNNDKRNDQEEDIYPTELVNVTEKFIRTFIENHPDHWKLMEVQYPLMALLICARSFSLIKFILFDNDSKAKNLHRPRSLYSSYPIYHDDLKLLKSDNDLKLALSFCRDQDAVMLAYLLEYYSENSVSEHIGHIGWMINVTKILPELSKHKYANYVDLLYYKSCFGEMKYNFPNKRFKTVLYKQDLLEVYLPLTQLIPTNFTSLVTYSNYKKLRYDMSSDICMVPLPNFTTGLNEETDEEPEETGKIEKFWTILKIFAKLLGKILIPINPFRLSLEDEHSPFLQVEKYNNPFFYIPAMEAVINSKWKQTKTNWMIVLIKYFIFLVLFSYLSQIYLKNEENNSKVTNIVLATIFYYIGIDLSIVQFLRMKNILSMLHTFDLCSTILSIINLTLIIVENERIIILTTVTTLILWIEMLLWLRLFTGIAINIYIFGNILKIIIPFFAFMIVLTVGFGHSMFILFGFPSLVDLHPSISTYTLNNGSENFTLTGTEPDNPFDTPLNAILSAYYWSTLSFGDYDYWPLKLLTFLANVALVLVLLNMIIALMNDAFTKAKEDGRHGLLTFRSELINDYERLYGADLYKSSQPSKYICFRQDSDLMNEWLSKSKGIGEEKLYSWFDDDSSDE